MKSTYRKQSSGIPQGSVLGPLLFVIFINDLPEVCPDEDLFLFADDAKLYKFIKNIQESLLLNESCQQVYNWCNKWGMKINITKCKVMTVHPNRERVKYDYYFTDENGVKTELAYTEEFCDLGVTFDNKLTFRAHVSNKINKANQMLGIIRRNFCNLDAFSFKILYFALVRSHLEYCHSVWNPHSVELIEDLEKVQKRATKLLSQCQGLSYTERLKYLKIPTLKYRRLRGDLIEAFKIIVEMYDNEVVPTIKRSEEMRTRGHGHKLAVNRTKYNLRKYSFTNRIVNSWNALPNSVVNASSLDIFKNKLDQHMITKDIYFDYKASSN